MAACSSGSPAKADHADQRPPLSAAGSAGPAVVEFEVTGAGTADVQWETLADPQTVSGVQLPWKKTVTAGSSVVIPKLSVTSANTDPSNEIACVIRIDGVLKRTKSKSGALAKVTCDAVDNALG